MEKLRRLHAFPGGLETRNCRRKVVVFDRSCSACTSAQRARERALLDGAAGGALVRAFFFQTRVVCCSARRSIGGGIAVGTVQCRPANRLPWLWIITVGARVCQLGGLRPGPGRSTAVHRLLHEPAPAVRMPRDVHRVRGLRSRFVIPYQEETLRWLRQLHCYWLRRRRWRCCVPMRHSWGIRQPP